MHKLGVYSVTYKNISPSNKHQEALELISNIISY